MPPEPAARIDRVAAHDLRSMINALLLAVDLLEVGDEDSRDAAAAVVRRNAMALSDLVDQLSGAQPQQPPVGSGAPAPRTGTRVLVVEDEYLLAQTVASHLKRAGCKVIGPAGSVQDTLELLPGAVLDCAIVDANLDGESAGPVVEALAARGVPAAMLSGYDQAAMPAACRHLPFLRKPVSAPDLLSMVAQLHR